MDDLSQVVKKKRFRQRKKKFNSSSEQEKNVAKKPKVISNLIVPIAKHIRFDTADQNNGTPDIDNGNKFPQFPMIDNKTPMKNLESLMALRQTSTPKIFIPPKKDKSMSKEKSIDSTIAKSSIASNESSKNMEIDQAAIQVKVGDIVDFKVIIFKHINLS